MFRTILKKRKIKKAAKNKNLKNSLIEYIELAKITQSNIKFIETHLINLQYQLDFVKKYKKPANKKTKKPSTLKARIYDKIEKYQNRLNEEKFWLNTYLKEINKLESKLS